MTIPLERFTQGPPETVRKLNALVDAVNQINVMTGDGIIKVRRTPDGIVFTADIQAIQEKMPKTPAVGTEVKIHAVFPVANASAGDTSSISCYVDIDNTGDPVNVNVEISGGGNLAAAAPLLFNGTRFYAEKSGNNYYSTTVFHAFEDCVCEEPA